MRNFADSDYALNKFSEGIVYKFSDGVVEVTLEDYLRDNPDKTEADFAKLKALSDEMFYEQDLADTRYGKRARNLDWFTESEEFAEPAPDTQLIQQRDEQSALKAARKLLEDKELTAVQERRFLLHFFKGMSYRKIAELEGVHFTSVQESIEAATRKLKRNFKNF